MKHLSKLAIVLFFLFVVTTVFAQSDNPTSADDDEFNLFLLSLLLIFVCAMIGAAIIGAMAATILLLFLFALMALGVLSTSIAVGLYKRSFSAGFKSFLMILFGLTGAIIAGIGLVLIDYLFRLPTSGLSSFLIGITGGLIGGLLLAIATHHGFQWLIRYLAQKLKPA